MRALNGNLLFCSDFVQRFKANGNIVHRSYLNVGKVIGIQADILPASQICTPACH